MIYLGVVVGLIIMAIMVFLAVDKKSNLPTRIAALIALAVMIITIIICVFLIFTDTSVPIDESILIVGAPPEKIESEGNSIWIMLLLIVFLIAIFGVIAFIAMKENKKHHSKAAETSLQISKKFDF